MSAAPRRLAAAALGVAILLAAGGLWAVIAWPFGPPPTHGGAPGPQAGATALPADLAGPPGAQAAGGAGDATPAVDRSAGRSAGSKTGSASAPAPPPPLGVYVGPGAQAATEAVDQVLGGRVAWVLDFVPRTSWTAIVGVTWLIADWAGAPFHFVLGVPMLPASGATLREGASGAYDGYFSLLAQRLVAGGMADAVLMVGWQPDDDGNPWYVGNAAAARAYVAYWDDIRSVMSAVPGAHFAFEWDVGDSGTSPVAAAAMYPGDADVDLVATDAFDTVPASVPLAERWSRLLYAPGGPAWLARFAAVHHKPVAIAMWGESPVSARGTGDDGAFVTQLLSWAAHEGAAMCVMWDQATKPWAITGGELPHAEAALLASISAGAGTG